MLKWFGLRLPKMLAEFFCKDNNYRDAAVTMLIQTGECFFKGFFFRVKPVEFTFRLLFVFRSNAHSNKIFNPFIYFVKALLRHARILGCFFSTKRRPLRFWSLAKAEFWYFFYSHIRIARLQCSCIVAKRDG